MKTRMLFGLTVSQAAGLLTLLVTLASVWVHMEIRIAEVNVEIVNLKQDLLMHKTENRKDIDGLRADFGANTQQILRKIDEIQIYLRDRH